MLVCQMVGRHESDHPSDQIQTTQYLPEHATRLDTQMSTASNVEELFIYATKLGRNRGFSSRYNSTFRRDSKSPAKPHNRNNGKKRDGSQRSSYWQSPGGRAYSPSRRFDRGRSPYKGNPAGRHKSTTPVSNPGQGRRGSGQRFTSKHGRRYERSPGGNSWRMSSKSPTPRRQFTQTNRGRPGNPSTSAPSCMRCGGTHNSTDCRAYGYWDGSPCAQCGLMHQSSLHRHRSTSAQRSNNSGTHRIQNYESEVVPSYPVNNPVNFFERKN